MLKLRGEHYYIICDKCGRNEYTDERTLEDGSAVMRQAGWMPMPENLSSSISTSGNTINVHVTGNAGGQWLCTDCKPKPSDGSMPSTPSSSPVSD